jgi:nitrite reductase/ring-hydroxylating ferredoxin subunit
MLPRVTAMCSQLRKVRSLAKKVLGSMRIMVVPCVHNENKCHVRCCHCISLWHVRSLLSEQHDRALCAVKGQTFAVTTGRLMAPFAPAASSTRLIT